MSPLNSNYIRQLTLSDFEAMYQIWEEGIAAAFSNPALTSREKQTFYRSFFQTAIGRQDFNFKIWGYFEENILVGWQSLLPCQSAPMIWHKYAEASKYLCRIKLDII